MPIPDYRVRFTKLKGHWYFDRPSQAAVNERFLAIEAKQENVPVWRLLANREEEAFGKIKLDVWSPVGR